MKQVVAPAAPVKAPTSAPTDTYTIVPPYIPRAKSAAPAALSTMSSTFPNAIQEEAFVKAVAAELFNLGFKRYDAVQACCPVMQSVQDCTPVHPGASTMGPSCGLSSVSCALVSLCFDYAIE